VIATNNGVRILNAVPESSNTATNKKGCFHFRIDCFNFDSIQQDNITQQMLNTKKGPAIGTWYCVYNGTGTSVEVTASHQTRPIGLHFRLSGEPGFETYSIAGGEGNPESFLSLPVSADEFTRGEIRATLFHSTNI
jgi:hypothetical protein